MIFYRSLNNPAGKPRPVRTMRLLTAGIPAAYAAGALLREFGPDRWPVQLAGLLLCLLSIIGLAQLAGSRLNRVVGEVPGRLDEYERTLRAEAMETAYALFAVLVLAGIIYNALGHSFGWWVPTSHDQWNGIFWGYFLTASVLPSAVLAFRLPADEDGEA